MSWSDELYRVFDARPGELEPSYEVYLSGIHAEDHERMQQALDASLQEPAGFNHQYRWVRPDSAVRTFHTRGEVIAGAGGRPAKVVGTSQDITERERVQAQVVQRAEAQAAVADLGEKALQGIELTALFREAVSSVSRVIAVEVAAVVEYAPEGFTVRAAVGPGADLVGAPVPGGERSQAGSTLMADQPVIVRDWDLEDRFEKPGVLERTGLDPASLRLEVTETPFWRRVSPRSPR